MAYVKHELGLLLRLDIDQAKKRLVAAYLEAGCNGERAAEDLGVTRRTFSRWVIEMGLQDRFARMRAAALKRRPGRAA
jgi:transposase-like protein